MTIHLVDRLVSHPVDILEDVLVNIGKFTIPCNFGVTDTDKSSQVSIIVRMPFLATRRVMMDVL